MKKLNSKGFALVETLIGALFVSVIFMVLFENYYPLVAKYERYDNYDDLDSKYVAYYIRDIINSASNEQRDNLFTQLENKLYVKFLTDNSDGESLCDFISTPQCSTYLQESDVSSIYLMNYETTKLKESIKTGETSDISRAFELYMDYMPTYSATAADKGDITRYARIVVEIKHENSDVDKEMDYYYTYSDIDISKQTENYGSCMFLYGSGNNPGDILLCGTEEFYVISSDDANYRLLSRYNLNTMSDKQSYALVSMNSKGVSTYQSSSSGPSSLTSSGNSSSLESSGASYGSDKYLVYQTSHYYPGNIIGIQNEFAGSMRLENNDHLYSYGIVPFSESNFWANSSSTSGQPVDINVSDSRFYSKNLLSDYKDYLDKIVLSNNIGMLTYNDIKNFCNSNGICDSKYAWLYNRNYWLASGFEKSTSFEGTVCANDKVLAISNIGSNHLKCVDYNALSLFGIRPVVEISKENL